MRPTTPCATILWASLLCAVFARPGYSQETDDVPLTLHFAASGQLAGAQLRLVSLQDQTAHPVEVALGGPNHLSLPTGDYRIDVEQPRGHTAWPPRLRAGAELTDIEVYSLVPGRPVEIKVNGIPLDEFAGYLAEEPPGTRVLPLGQPDIGRTLWVPCGDWKLRAEPHTLHRVFVDSVESALIRVTATPDDRAMAVVLSMTPVEFEDWYLFCLFRTTNGLPLPVSCCDVGGPMWSNEEVVFFSGFRASADSKSPIWSARVFDLKRKFRPDVVGKNLRVWAEMEGLGIKDETWDFSEARGDDRLVVVEHTLEIETATLEVHVQDERGDPVSRVEFTIGVLSSESSTQRNRTIRTDQAGRAILANIPRDEGFEVISVEEGWSIDSPTPNRFIHFRDFKDPLVIRIRDARLPTPAAPSAPALRRVSSKHALEVEFQRSHLRQIYRPIMENRAPVVEEAPKREPDGSWLLGSLGAGTYSWSMLTPWGVKQVPFTVSTGAEVELAGPWHTSVTNDAPLRGRVTTRNGASDNWFVVAGSADLTMAPMIQTAARAGVPPWMASVATDGSFSLEKHDQADPYVTLIAPGVAATRIRVFNYLCG